MMARNYNAITGDQEFLTECFSADYKRSKDI